MPATFVNHTLCTRACLLPDGRRITLRHAVPSDAPRIAIALGPSREVAWGSGLIALDDHGAVAGHVTSPTDVVVAAPWSGSGLAELLTAELKED